MAVIFWLSSFSGSTTEGYLIRLLALLPFVSPETARVLQGPAGQAAHFTEYFVLGLLSYRALRPGRTLRSAMTGALLLSAIYAVSDELHQGLVPSRTASLTDCATDIAGAFAAQGIILAARRGAGRLSGRCRASP